jgi:hypothetical protein
LSQEASAVTLPALMTGPGQRLENKAHGELDDALLLAGA